MRSTTSATRKSYLGYRGEDSLTDFADFFDPQMAPLPGHVVDALHHGPQADQAMLGFDCAAQLLDGDPLMTDTGYAHLRGGGFAVSVRTDMPAVTPAMWQWWFGWHGSDTRRYKLWHPRAHTRVRWTDGGADSRYLERTSLVEEYIGSAYARAAIRFVTPDEMGVPSDRLGDSVAVCARLGSPDVPVDIGWLIHHVHPTASGAQMRSWFWMGGPFVGVRNRNTVADKIVRPFANRMLPDPRDLLVHCAQEMNHLAAFLPDLSARFG